MKTKYKTVRGYRCLMCGQPAEILWALDNTAMVSAAYLCLKDSEPLLAVMGAAGDIAPNKQIPLPDRQAPGRMGSDVYRPGKMEPMAPLLDWTPPD